ncbi:MAG: hypothetical protein ABS76_31885 [Pelagibacterium sp. SCN 64-44]|nr:MAG: hypothetical protein ABS76_31885 [Pelagibacterium sp. SCN 64-44]
MRLYYGTPSPYSRKVRVAAHELSVPLELVATNALAWDNGFGAINPTNRVPALVLDDGRVLFDSPVICEYLDVTCGSKLLPGSGPARWEVLVRQALGDGLMDAAVPRRYEVLRPNEQQSAERLRLYRRSLDQIVAHLEAEADRMDLFDLGAISVACALAYLDFRFPEDGWRAQAPRLSAWLEKVVQRPSMLATEYA